MNPAAASHKFSALAARYAHRDSITRQRWPRASRAFLCSPTNPSAGRWPCQVKQYAKAAPTFGVRFERRILDLPYRGTTTQIPVHLLSPTEHLTQTCSDDVLQQYSFS